MIEWEKAKNKEEEKNAQKRTSIMAQTHPPMAKDEKHSILWICLCYDAQNKATREREKRARERGASKIVTKTTTTTTTFVDQAKILP